MNNEVRLLSIQIAKLCGKVDELEKVILNLQHQAPQPEIWTPERIAFESEKLESEARNEITQGLEQNQAYMEENFDHQQIISDPPVIEEYSAPEEEIELELELNKNGNQQVFPFNDSLQKTPFNHSTNLRKGPGRPLKLIKTQGEKKDFRDVSFDSPPSPINVKALVFDTKEMAYITEKKLGPLYTLLQAVNFPVAPGCGRTKKYEKAFMVNCIITCNERYIRVARVVNIERLLEYLGAVDRNKIVRFLNKFNNG